MVEGIAIVISITLYKLVSLATGLAFAYMGYRLFMAGVWGNSGDMDAQLKDLKVVMKKAAPGTFFVAFGAIIVGSTVFKGLEFTNGGRALNTNATILEPNYRVEELPDTLPDIGE